MRRSPFRRLGFSLRPQELERAREAAKIRGCPVGELARQALVLISDETLSRSRFEVEPFERQNAVSFPLPRRR